jgi:flagellar protein FlaJ
MLEEYSDFCYDQVGGYVLPYMDSFEGLRPQLPKAGIEVSLPEYVSMMAFSSLLGFTVSLVLLSVIFLVSAGIAGIFMALAFSIVIGAAVGIGFYVFPSLQIKNRASRIEDNLPFATMYLSTLAGTGTSLPAIFDNLSDADEYGELAEEAEKIYRDIDTFGLDMSEALQRGAERSPSNDFKELLWGMDHVLTTGGSLREFLDQRAESYMEDYRRRIEEFSDQLSLLVEMYITLVVVGSIIFTSMSIVMSTFTSFQPETVVFIQTISIFLGLPVISFMFILMIDGMSPGGIQ